MDFLPLFVRINQESFWWIFNIEILYILVILPYYDGRFFLVSLFLNVSKITNSYNLNLFLYWFFLYKEPVNFQRRDEIVSHDSLSTLPVSESAAI